MKEVKGNSFILSRRGQTCMRHATHVKALPNNTDEWPTAGEKTEVQAQLPPAVRQQPWRAAKAAPRYLPG